MDTCGWCDTCHADPRERRNVEMGFSLRYWHHKPSSQLKTKQHPHNSSLCITVDKILNWTLHEETLVITCKSICGLYCICLLWLTYTLKLGRVWLTTLHPGAKRLSSIQTGLVASLSHWLEWRAVKWLYTGVNAVVTGVGTRVFFVLIDNLPHLLLWASNIRKGKWSSVLLCFGRWSAHVQLRQRHKKHKVQKKIRGWVKRWMRGREEWGSLLKDKRANEKWDTEIDSKSVRVFLQSLEVFLLCVL